MGKKFDVVIRCEKCNTVLWEDAQEATDGVMKASLPPKLKCDCGHDPEAAKAVDDIIRKMMTDNISV